MVLNGWLRIEKSNFTIAIWLDADGIRHQTERMESESNKSKLFIAVRNLLIGFVVSTFVTAYLTLQWYFAPVSDGNTGHWRMVFTHYWIVCYLWSLLAFGIC